MIRYPVTEAKLRQLLEAEKPGWLADAAARTENFRQKGKYEERSSIWSKVKPAYMKLQGNCKCAYCERKMESVDFGKSEQDVEHFRPKGNVKAWRVPKEIKDAGVVVTKVPDGAKGYYLLPYHLFNYAAACKPCNSALKRDYFPIAGTYNLDADDPANLVGEQDYLVYPIGDLDDDPETLIEFHGASPQPVADHGFKRHRALVTIWFFRLDDHVKRKNLFRARALIIMALFPLLQETAQGTATERAAACAKVDAVLKPELSHLNCAKSYRRLYERDAAQAAAVYEAAQKLIMSIS